MAYCANCGAQVADGVAFCPNCGKAAAAAGASSAARPAATPAPAMGAASTASGSMAENVAGMLAYFTIIPAIVFLLVEPYKSSRFVRFHSFQCLFTVGALIVLQIALSIVGYALPVLVFPFWTLLGLAELALWLLLVIKAYQGQMFKLPIVGDMAEKQAGA